jgi:cell division protein FtsI (penicillin-binding protein 3)/stage V sporulation protein D (sporulation-specific penicillin-binding protein)
MYVVVSVIILTYVVFIGRLFDLQFVKHDDFLNEGIKQYSINLQDDFTRGKIFFSKNNAPDVIAADVDESTIKRNDKDVVVRNRVYTYGDLAAKVLGFVAYDEHSRVGRYGIEKYYNDILERESSKLYTNFFAEVFGDVEGGLSTSTPRGEGNITLTIDVEAQKYLHTVLADTQKEWRSDTIGGIIMDPSDGRIIAMEELPTFDPNNFNTVQNQSLFKNDMVSGVYEMGSILKPITMASALDAGVVDENTFYNDAGSVMLNGRKVSNYDGVARGHINVQQILSQSLNVGTVFLVQKLGTENFQEYFKKFGLGSETGIDLPNEASGLTKNLSSSILVDSATAGFGQGIAITPIQTIRALAVLGNGGKLVNPYIVDKITYSTGIVKNITPDDAEQILATTTSERITRMLVNVVDNSLVKGKKKMEHYSVAAKTGTAQMVAPNGKYYEDRYLHSFFGYFPAYDPKFIVFLYHTYPKGAQYASQTLTDPFFKIADFLISYYSVPPDR